MGCDLSAPCNTPIEHFQLGLNALAQLIYAQMLPQPVVAHKLSGLTLNLVEKVVGGAVNLAMGVSLWI
jgi:hypothetical protein